MGFVDNKKKVISTESKLWHWEYIAIHTGPVFRSWCSSPWNFQTSQQQLQWESKWSVRPIRWSQAHADLWLEEITVNHVSHSLRKKEPQTKEKQKVHGLALWLYSICYVWTACNNYILWTMLWNKTPCKQISLLMEMETLKHQKMTFAEN